MGLSSKNTNMGGVLQDNVNHPRHYENTCSLECIEVMRLTYGKRAVYDFCLCNAFKYMWRFKNKNGKEDLEKANWYLSYVEKNLNKTEHYEQDEIDRYAIDKVEDLRQLLIDIQDKVANKEILNE